MTTALQVVVVLLLLISCSRTENEHIEAVTDRSATPKMRALDVSTVISDSGITRYRMNTPVWEVYDRAPRPYWEFPLGIHIERFDEKLKVDANIHADFAKYLEQEQIWELKGTVRATNIQGELFETEQLFWDQRAEKIYSDSLIKITQAKYIIIGVGFSSNQVMTKYEVRNTRAVLPVEDDQ